MCSIYIYIYITRVFWAGCLGVVVITPQSPAPLGKFLGPCRVSCCVLCCQGSRLEPKRAGNYTHAVPQSDPRVTQIPTGGPSKTYGIFSVGARLSHFGRSWTIPFVSVCFPGAYFLRFPVTFHDIICVAIVFQWLSMEPQFRLLFLFYMFVQTYFDLFHFLPISP